MRGLSLRRQILRGQILSWVLVALIGVAVFLSINRNAALTDERKMTQAQLTQIGAIQSDVLDLETGMRGYLVTGTNAFLDPYNRALGRFDQDIAAQREMLAKDRTDPETRRLQEAMLRDIEAQVNLWRTNVAEPEITRKRDNPSAYGSPQLQTRGKQLIDDTRNAIDRYRAIETTALEERTDAANRSLALLKWMTAAGLAGAVLASVLSSLWLANAISRPTVRLARGAQQLADGVQHERVAEQGAKEFRQLAHAFNEMAAKLELSQADLAGQNAILSAQARDLERAGVMDHTIGDALRAFTSSYDRDAILHGLLRTLAERHGFLVGAIYRYDEWAGEFVAAARHGTARDLRERLGLREGVVGQAVLDRRVVVVTQQPLLTVETGLATAPAAAAVIVPIYYQDRIMGAMTLGNADAPDEATLTFLDQLAQQLGIALQNLDQYTNLQQLSGQLQARQEEIERKNRELERADRMKSEFLANMSHELRTPLNAIIGFSELLAEQFYGPLNSDQSEYLGNIHTAGEHLLSLINDILDLSKIEAGRMELDVEELDLPAALASSLTIVKEKATNHGVRLACDAGDTGAIVADARKLKQILFNLLSNAVKFTPAGGTVSLAARTDGAFAEIAVTDTGVGISPEDQGKLFREFTQVDGSLSRRHEGTGLGLALTKRLIELHGGTISVRSAPGEGSTFTVRLPLAGDRGQGTGDRGEKSAVGGRQSPDSTQHSALSTQHSNGSPLILVIEDDDPTADLVAAYLESAGYRTARATNGEEGLAMARELRPDGITLDVMLPVMDGWTFLERVGADPDVCAIPVVVLSMTSDLRRGFSLGAAAVLAKPVRREELVQALTNVNLATPTGEPARVLVVDDDPKAVELVGDYLASFGHQVYRAHGGAHGIELAEREHPDLVILDLMMPEVNGFVVVERLRANPRTVDIPIIILTAKIVTPEERQRLNGHIVAVAEKSGINRAAFLSEVNRAVRQQGSADSGQRTAVSGQRSAVGIA